MARYRLAANAYVNLYKTLGSQFVKAGAEIEVADAVVPAISWEPLDATARAAVAERNRRNGPPRDKHGRVVRTTILSAG